MLPLLMANAEAVGGFRTLRSLYAKHRQLRTKGSSLVRGSLCRQERGSSRLVTEGFHEPSEVG